MEIRRGGELDLAALGGGAVLAEDEGENFVVEIEDHRLVLLGEIASLGAQLIDDRVTARGGEAGPLEIVEHLQVAKIGVGEGSDDGTERSLGVIAAALGEQFGVARNGADERFPVDLEEVLEEETAVAIVEIRSGFAAETFPIVLDRAGDQLENLPDEHGREVEVDPDAGLRGDEVNHVEITLGGVEAHPRHHGLFRQGIDVVGLVHVPENDHFHARTSPRSERAASSG